MSTYTEDQWLAWIDELSENDYVVINNFLFDEILLKIEHFFKEKQAEDDFHKASIGPATDSKIISEIRGDYTFWLDKKRDHELDEFFDLIQETIAKLNRYCYLSLTDFEFHLAYYPKGSYYHKHLDQFNNRSNRLISFIIYLNENWKEGDGGELKVYRDSGDVIVAPLYNRAILFKSGNVPHEVLMTHKGRRSVTGWLLYQPAGLGYLLG